MNKQQAALQDLSRQVLDIRPNLTEPQLDEAMSALIYSLINDELEDFLRETLDGDDEDCEPYLAFRRAIVRGEEDLLL